MSFGSINPLQLRIVGTLTKSVSNKTLSTQSTFEYLKNSITSGTTADKADLWYEARRTVTDSGTPDTFDLSGSLTDPWGDAVVFAEVTGIFVVNQHATATLTVGAGSNPFYTFFAATGDAILVGPGGFFGNYNPAATAWAVTAGTGDIVTVATSAGSSVPYDVLIIGRSA